MRLIFDAELHAYYLGDERLPSVTGVLDPVLTGYAKVPPGILAAAAARGTYVHRACELLLWGTLDWSGIEESYLGYVKAFDRFLAESGVDIELPEQRVYHRTLHYAGTADLICKLPRRRKVRRSVVDYKTCFRLMPAVGPQVNAYKEAINSHEDSDSKVEDGYALHLKADGNYRLEPFNEPQHFNVFRACLTIHNFIAKENIV